MNTNKFASTNDVYNQHAAQFVQHFERKLDTTELDAFLKGVPTGGYILDAGCGSARDSAYMISKGYRALGIDLSEGLLAEAQRLHPEVPTQVMSLTNIDFPSDTFDGVWCKAALLHLDRADIPHVLKSFANILKPGGKLFIQTKAGEGEGTQPVPFDQKLTRYFTFFTLDELQALVRDAGFRITKAYDFNGQARNMISRDQDWIVILAGKE